MSDHQSLSLREHHKRHTRSLIAQAAERLFAQHGFRDVTIDTVAQEAGVARQTVFNHFPVKEDLVFDRTPELEAQMVAAVRDRPAGSSLVAAFRACHHAFWMRMHAVPDPRPRGGFFDLVAASPALQAYGRELNSRTARRIAEVIAGASNATTDEMRPQVIADALLAVYAATFEAIQRHIVAGEHPREFLDTVLVQADAAFELLENGMAATCDEASLNYTP